MPCMNQKKDVVLLSSVIAMLFDHLINIELNMSLFQVKLHNVYNIPRNSSHEILNSYQYKEKIIIFYSNGCRQS